MLQCAWTEPCTFPKFHSSQNHRRVLAIYLALVLSIAHFIYTFSEWEIGSICCNKHAMSFSPCLSSKLQKLRWISIEFQRLKSNLIWINPHTHTHTNVIAANPSNWVLNKNFFSMCIHIYISPSQKAPKSKLGYPSFCQANTLALVCVSVCLSACMYITPLDLCMCVYNDSSSNIAIAAVTPSQTHTDTHAHGHAHTTVLTQPKLSLPMRNCLLFEIRSASISLLSLSHCA